MAMGEKSAGLLNETIEVLNKRLKLHYGLFEDGRPFWQIVWSEDQYEKRLTEYTDEGFRLLIPEVRILPKYKQYIHEKYILERLMPVPELQRIELTTKTSYEPVWIYQDKDENYLPPDWDVTKIVIDKVYEQSAIAVGKKYKSDEREGLKTEEQLEMKRIEIDKLRNQLFPDTSSIVDDLVLGQAVSVPSNYNKEN